METLGKRFFFVPWEPIESIRKTRVPWEPMENNRKNKVFHSNLWKTIRKHKLSMGTSRKHQENIRFSLEPLWKTLGELKCSVGTHGKHYDNMCFQ